MNTNIAIQNINKHFLMNSEEDIFNQNLKKYKTKIIDLCFLSINEANISDIVKKINNYNNYFNLIEYYDYISIKEISEEIYQTLHLNTEKKYLIFKYINKNYFPFHDFLFKIDNPKNFIFYIIESFSFLLKSLILLNENNICFFNLSSSNIFFYFNKPILHHFENSLQILKLSSNYIEKIILTINDFTNKPIEVHILYYIIKNNLSSISYSLIEEICEKYVNNLSILNLFSENYKSSYKLNCIDYLKIYINLPKNEIIKAILKENNTWDIFSLCVIYIHLFGNYAKIFSLNNSFLNNILMELCKNIHPNPSKRNTLKNLQDFFENCLNIDWSFINSLNYEKMNNLFNKLER